MADPQNHPPTPPNQEDEPRYDDALLSRAIRWSILVLTILTLLGTVGFLLLRPKSEPLTQKVTPILAPETAKAATATPPQTRFTNITLSHGINFTHENGAYGEKLLPETMGGGVAFFDMDQDNDADLLLVNSTWWPWHPKATNTPPPTTALFRNDNGHFTNITHQSGLDHPFYGMGAACGDYDNDGLPDVLLTGIGGCRLFHNQGQGRFVDVTETAGVGGSINDWSTCSTWFDLDNDGDLDLFVGNYIRWSPDIDREVSYSLVGIGRAYGQPTDFQGAFPHLYRNDGKGRFTNISKEAGIQVRNPSTEVPVAKPLGVSPVDINHDGYTDLVIANDTVQNMVFINLGNGTMQEIGALTGIAFDNYGNTRGAMGIDSASFRNDNTIGIAIGNFANEMTALYVSQRNPTNFTDEAITEGIGPASRLLLKFGIFFLDYDLDGWLDLLSSNGHLEDEISLVQQSQSYAQPAQLFWNTGAANQAGFVEVSPETTGPDLFKPIVGRGSAYADIDLDGDLDVILAQTGGTPLLLRNDQQTGHHWLRISLQGTTANVDALGAVVRLKANGTTQTRTVTPTRSYLSQSELPITFGLGSYNGPVDIEIQWPGSQIQHIHTSQIDTTLKIRQE